VGRYRLITLMLALWAMAVATPVAAQPDPLAAASTDQCSVAVFAASPPSVHLPNADLSGYRTGRGLHIGSTYADVLRIYRSPVARYSRHFIAAYSASIPATTDTLPRQRVLLPELITLVITNGRVASMTLSVDMGGLY
jgi:hypothetical protein